VQDLRKAHAARRERVAALIGDGAPRGLGGRGVPPSVVENAIEYGKQMLGNKPDTLKHVYDNVTVITTDSIVAARRVITVFVKKR
jgi:hypothetical protein